MRVEWKLLIATIATASAFSACGKDDDNPATDAGDAESDGVDTGDGTSIDGDDDTDATTPVTCSDLDCEDQQRECVAGTDGEDSTCGQCVEGYEDVDGACVPVTECEVDADCGEPVAGVWEDCEYASECTATGLRRRTVTTFSCESGACEGERNEETEAESPACDRSTEFELCEDGVCRDQACTAILSCEDLDCAEQRRDCLEGSGEGAEPTCGDCSEGSVEYDGICAPAVRCDEDIDCGEPVPGPWGACGWADGCDELGDRERGVASFACESNACVPQVELESETDSDACSRDTAAIACDGGYCVASACEDFDFCAELDCAGANRACVEADGIDSAVCTVCLPDYVDRDGNCERLVQCDDLDCAAASRGCTEAAGAVDAFCTDCIDGFRDDGGTCVAVATCADLACADSNRECTERDGTTDASCGACSDGFRDDAGTCIAVFTCADLTCDIANRGCVERDGTTDAYCGACVDGFRDNEGFCQPVATCADIDCASQNRDCVERDGTTDAYCDGCVDGFRDNEAFCEPVATCATIECGAQNRSCVERVGTTDAYCDACLSGFVDDAGNCVPGDCTGDGDCAGTSYGAWSACTFDDACDALGDRSRTVTDNVCLTFTCGDISHLETENDTAACARDTERDSCGVGGQCFSGTCVEVAPTAPTGVTATDGTFVDRVEITWDAATNARGYVVYRNGAALAVVAGTSFSDSTAAAGTVGAPTNVVASTTEVAEVFVTWDAAPAFAGAAANYTVAAYNDLGVGSPGVADSGHRAAPAINSYEVEVDGDEWLAGTVSPFTDSAAPAPSVVFTNVNLNRGEFTDRVRCEAVVTPTPGAEVAYRVRAVSELGLGDESDPAYGHRAPGAVTLQWRRTTVDDSAAAYSNIAGGTTAVFVNTPIAITTPGGLWYSLRATMTDVGTFDTDPKRANLYYEGAPCDDSCFFGVCSNGYCAPNGYATLPPGSFTMGSPVGEIGRAAGALENQVAVTLTNTIFMNRTEVTQGEWLAIYGVNPSARAACSTCPVENVTWYSTVDFTNRLSTLAGLPECYTLTGCDGATSAAAGTLACTGVTINTVSGAPYDCTGFRLPMEAEWEYGYRAGTTTAIYSGTINSGTGCAAANEPDLTSIAYYCGNSPVAGSTFSCPTTPTATPCGTQPGGNRGANAWGLRDMAGNVAEWTFDYFYGAAASIGGTDPVNPVDATFRRVIRGGSFLGAPTLQRAAAKERVANTRGGNRGFRVVRTSPW